MLKPGLVFGALFFVAVFDAPRLAHAATFFQARATPQCSDFLADIQKKPDSLQFVACKKIEEYGLAALESEYHVAGAHAASVEGHFVKTANMSKLRYACCGWETPHPYGNYLFAKDHKYVIRMTSVETAQSSRSKWREIPYFTVRVWFSI